MFRINFAVHLFVVTASSLPSTTTNKPLFNSRCHIILFSKAHTVSKQTRSNNEKLTPQDAYCLLCYGVRRRLFRYWLSARLRSERDRESKSSDSLCSTFLQSKLPQHARTHTRHTRFRKYNVYGFGLFLLD